MKTIRFTLSMPAAPFTGTIEYDDEEYQEAVRTGEIYYHGLSYFNVEEHLELTYEEVDDETLEEEEERT